MKGLTEFSELTEILTVANTVKLLNETGRYGIEADAETISVYLSELQSMALILNNGLSALNFSLVDLMNEAEVSRDQLVNLLMLQTGLNELNHVISEAAHAIAMATPTSDQL